LLLSPEKVTSNHQLRETVIQLVMSLVISRINDNCNCVLVGQQSPLSNASRMQQLSVSAPCRFVCCAFGLSCVYSGTALALASPHLTVVAIYRHNRCRRSPQSSTTFSRHRDRQKTISVNCLNVIGSVSVQGCI